MMPKKLVHVIFILYLCTCMPTILHVSSFEDINLIKCLTAPASFSNTSGLSVDVSMIYENALKIKVISQKESSYFLSCGRLNIDETWSSNSRDLTCPKENHQTLSVNATYLESIGGIFYIETVTVSGSSRKQCMIDIQDETTSQIILSSIGVTTKRPKIQTQLNPVVIVIPIIVLVLVVLGVIGCIYKKIPLIETVRTILRRCICKREEQRKSSSSEHAEVDHSDSEEEKKFIEEFQEDDSLAAKRENFHNISDQKSPRSLTITQDPNKHSGPSTSSRESSVTAAQTNGEKRRSKVFVAPEHQQYYEHADEECTVHVDVRNPCSKDA